MTRMQYLAGILAVCAIVVSTTLLALIVVPHGLSVDLGDSFRYVIGAANLVSGRGYIVDTYDPVTSTLGARLVSHYPPLLSIGYAIFLLLGAPLLLAPSLMNLLCWVALLLGIGVLTYRLSKHPWIAALAVVTTAVTHAYLALYTSALSEVLFLPLLVWTMVVCVDLHQREHGVLPRLAMLATLLAALMLTRYSGVFLVGGVGLWWIWARLSQRVPRHLLWELPVLASAGLPLAGWLLYTTLSTSRPVGSHFRESGSTFLEGLIAVAQQATQLLLPSFPSPDVMPENGFWHFSIEVWAGMVFYVLLPLLLLLLSYMFWRLYPGRRQIIKEPRSPILVCLAIYLGLYIFLQPFMRFWPMDQRDSTTMLVLAMPWLFAATVPVFQRYAVPIVATFTAVNVALVLVPISLYAIPNVVTRVPPQVHSMADRRADRLVLLEKGVPSWLLTHVRRTHDIKQHHPDLLALINQIDGELVVARSVRTLFYAKTTSYSVLPSYSFIPESTMESLAENHCTAQSVTMLVVLFEWDYLRPTYPRLRQRLEDYCPHAPRTRLEHTLVYRLDQTIPEYPQGQQYLEQGRWDDAIAIFDAALAFNPENVQAYADRGTASMGLEAWDAALADFEQSIARMPGWSFPYQQRAVVYEALGEPRLAQADRAQATELELAYLGTTPTNRLTLLAEQGDWERLITEATAALAEDPTDIGVLYRRANAYRRLGKQDAALADYTRIIEIDPTYALAYHKRGLIYREQGDWEQALADLNQAVTLEPDTMQFRQDRLTLLAEQGDWEHYVTEATNILTDDPTDIGILYRRANAYRRLGEQDAALADYTRIIEIDPTYALAYHKRGLAYREQGNAAQALADYSRSIELRPDFAPAYYVRAQIYAERGDEEAARADYKQVLELSDDPALRAQAQEALAAIQ